MNYFILEALACVRAVFVVGMLAFILCATLLLVWEALARVFHTTYQIGARISQLVVDHWIISASIQVPETQRVPWPASRAIAGLQTHFPMSKGTVKWIS